MEHPVQYVARLTRFLDRLIQDHGDYLFVAVGFICLFLIAWILCRRRKPPLIWVVILGQPPKRDAARPSYEKHSDL